MLRSAQCKDTLAPVHSHVGLYIHLFHDSKMRLLHSGTARYIIYRAMSSQAFEQIVHLNISMANRVMQSPSRRHSMPLIKPCPHDNSENSPTNESNSQYMHHIHMTCYESNQMPLKEEAVPVYTLWAHIQPTGGVRPIYNVRAHAQPTAGQIVPKPVSKPMTTYTRERNTSCRWPGRTLLS